VTPRLPGRVLLFLARLLFDRAVYDSAIVPAIADLQAEWLTATNARERMLARWRGLVAFASLVVLSPIAFRAWPGRERGDGAPVVTLALTLVAGISLWMWRVEIAQAVGGMVEGKRTPVLATIAWASVGIGPLLVSAYLLIRRHVASEGEGAAGVLLILALLSISMPLAASSAAVINEFSVIGRTGSAGFEPVIGAVRTGSIPVFFAMLAVTFALALVSREAFTSRPQPSDTSTLPQSSAIPLMVLAAGVLVGMHLLLGLQHRVMAFLVQFLGLTGPQPPGTVQRVVAESEYLIYLFVGAVVATAALIVLAAATWRALRDHRQPAWFRQASRAVAVIALAGTAWHTTVAYRDMRAVMNLEARLTSLRPPPQPPGAGR
jgi:hypothetical protein